MGAGDGAGGSLSAEEIFVCEGDLCLRRISLFLNKLFTSRPSKPSMEVKNRAGFLN